MPSKRVNAKLLWARRCLITIFFVTLHCKKPNYDIKKSPFHQPGH